MLNDEHSLRWHGEDTCDSLPRQTADIIFLLVYWRRGSFQMKPKKFEFDTPKTLFSPEVLI